MWKIFRDKNNILEAKSIVIDIITKANVPVDIAKTFINSTFANSGKTGQYKEKCEMPSCPTRQFVQPSGVCQICDDYIITS